MDEFVCLTVCSHPGEDRAAFAGRLSRFWTHMLRTRPDEFAKVYAEATAFDLAGDRLTRQYLAEPGVTDLLTRELAVAGVAFEPIDPDDLFTKYEAVAPDWMQIEH